MVQPRDEHAGSGKTIKSGQILDVPGRQSFSGLQTNWMQSTRE